MQFLIFTAISLSDLCSNLKLFISLLSTRMATPPKGLPLRTPFPRTSSIAELATAVKLSSKLDRQSRLFGSNQCSCTKITQHVRHSSDNIEKPWFKPCKLKDPIVTGCLKLISLGCLLDGPLRFMHTFIRSSISSDVNSVSFN